MEELARHEIQADPVVGLKTPESTHGIEPYKKQWKMGDVSLMTAEGQKSGNKSDSLNTNSFLVLTAVKVFLRTLAQTGTYYVDDPQDERPQSEKTAQPTVPSIERELIEGHLAQCHAFALGWSTKAQPPSNAAITHRFARID